MTLTEFLLARIAEDENESASLHRIGCNFMIDGLGGAPLDSCDCDGPARVLAECAAKRGVLDLHGSNEYHSKYFCECQDMDGIIMGEEPCDTKRFLALPYWAHPDYRDEWRP